MTRLGFGCATLMRLDNAGERARILAAAYEEGIRHFDVAPSYGMGLAEGELGKFLFGKRDQVTLATKFGISPSPLARTLNPIQSFLRRVLKISPMSRRLARAGAMALVNPKRFDAASAMRSLRSSLRELRTDYLDVFLLHEPGPSDFIDPALLPAVREQVERGAIRSVGIAGSFEHSGSIIVRHPEFRDVVQIDNDVLGAQLQNIDLSNVSLIITYGSIGGPLVHLRGFLERRRAVAREWSRDLDVDMDDPEVLPRLLFGCAIETNADGVVLFSSTQVAHVRQAVKWFHGHAAYAPKVARLMDLARQNDPISRSVVLE